MSIKHMTLVWEHSQHEGTALLLLLAIADCANDKGEAHPGREFLARRIRMTESYVREIIKGALLPSKELKLVHRGGSGPHDPHVYRICVKGKPASPNSKGKPASPNSKGKPASPLGEAKGRLRGGDHAQFHQEPLRTNRTILTTSIPQPPLGKSKTKVAAAAVENGWWNLDGLMVSGKVHKSRNDQIRAMNPPPVTSAYIGYYLYAMTLPNINAPSLFAAKKLIDAPGGFAGEPFDSLAEAGPETVARCLMWINGDKNEYLDGIMPLALALEGFLPKKVDAKYAAMRAINELGLSALAKKSEPSPDTEEIELAPTASPRELNDWERIVAAISPTISRPASERLQRCILAGQSGTRLIVTVPTQQEFDWLRVQMLPSILRHADVELQVSHEN